MPLHSCNATPTVARRALAGMLSGVGESQIGRAHLQTHVGERVDESTVAGRYRVTYPDDRLAVEIDRAHDEKQREGGKPEKKFANVPSHLVNLFTFGYTMPTRTH